MISTFNVAAIAAANLLGKQNDTHVSPMPLPASQPNFYTVAIRKYFTFANYTKIAGNYLQSPGFQTLAFTELTKIPGVDIIRVPSRTVCKEQWFNLILDNTSPIEYVKQNIDTFLSSSVWDNTKQEVIKMYLDWVKSDYEEAIIDESKLICVENVFYEIFYYDNKSNLVSLYSTSI